MIAGGSIRRFDTLVILISLAGVALLAWWYLYTMAVDMASMAEMPDMPTMAISDWDRRYALMMFLMWSIMMVGMMLPSVTPAVLIYHAVAKKAKKDGNAITPTWVFTAGYLLTWILFSVLATAAQWGLDQAALLSPTLIATSDTLGAAVLISAGIYQWTPVKNACLRHCRSPAEFISSHWRTGNFGALTLGARHGLYCTGCCWILMGLLFLGGVMNLWWIALITVFVLAEKIMPYGSLGGKIVGLLMISAGATLIIHPELLHLR